MLFARTTKVFAAASALATRKSLAQVCSRSRWSGLFVSVSNSSNGWYHQYRRYAFVGSAMCFGSIPLIGLGSLQLSEREGGDGTVESAASVICRLCGFIETRTEAARPSQPDKLVDISPVPTEIQTTWTQSLRSFAAMSSFVLPFTVVAPAMCLTFVVYPFVFGIKSFLALITLGVTVQFIPIHYSRSFLESYGMQVFLRDLALYFESFRVLRPSTPLDDSKTYIFAWHPHGRLFIGSAFFQGMFHNWFPELWKKQNLFIGINPPLLLVPIVGQFLQLCGAISVSRPSIKSALGKGDSVAIVIGGIEEVLEGTYDDRDVLYLKQRKGFCKLAIEHGSGVVPCFCFGENALFQHDSPLRLAFWRWVNKHVKVGVLSPLLGRYLLPMPYPQPLLVVLGEPLFPASGESLDHFHARYMAAIAELHARHVTKSAQPAKRLVIH